jgi:hypothetical protein
VRTLSAVSDNWANTYNDQNRLASVSRNGVEQASYLYNFAGQQLVRTVWQGGLAVKAVTAHDAGGSRLGGTGLRRRLYVPRHAPRWPVPLLAVELSFPSGGLAKFNKIVVPPGRVPGPAIISAAIPAIDPVGGLPFHPMQPMLQPVDPRVVLPGPAATLVVADPVQPIQPPLQVIDRLSLAARVANFRDVFDLIGDAVQPLRNLTRAGCRLGSRGQHHRGRPYRQRSDCQGLG